MGGEKSKKCKKKKSKKKRRWSIKKNKMKHLLQWAFHFSKCMPNNLQRTNSS
jgi:hypothetical protein